MTPKTSPEGHDRRDVPGSCRARSPALHVGGRDRVASWSWSRTSHPHAHLHAQLGLISASAAPSAVIYHRHAHALEELVARRCCCHPPVFRRTRRHDCHATPRGGLCAVRPTLADALPVLLPAAARSVSPASTRSKPEPAGRISLAAANRPLLRCSAASQPRRPAPRRLPWRQLCDCVCVYCVWGNAGNAGDAGTRGVH